MKNIIKESLRKLITDRYLTILLISMTLLALTASIAVGFAIQPSELQLVSHYSAFGITHLYRDQWFYLIVFPVFEIAVALLHSAISIKLLIVKDRSIALMFAWLGVGIVIFGWVTASALLNVWTPL